MMEAHEAQLQVYIDDILMMARGTIAELNSLVAMGLYTLKAFGVNFSLGKGERGSALKWIGVKILLNWGPGPSPGELVYFARLLAGFLKHQQYVTVCSIQTFASHF